MCDVYSVGIAILGVIIIVAIICLIVSTRYKYVFFEYNPVFSSVCVLVIMVAMMGIACLSELSEATEECNDEMTVTEQVSEVAVEEDFK